MTSTERFKLELQEADQRMKWQQAALSVENLQNGNLTQARKVAKGLGWGYIYDLLTNRSGWSDKKAAACADYLTKRIDFRAYCEAIR
jgi:hypothetical protein